jgi:hypothetical protein
MVDKLDGFLFSLRHVVKPGNSYRHAVESPFDRLWRKTLSSHMPREWCQTFSCNVDIGIRLTALVWLHGRSPTSTVSKTLITPGCRRVRSFRSAFFASCNLDFPALTSKEKTLHFEPSSLSRLAKRRESGRDTDPLRAVMKSPYRVFEIHSIVEAIRKSWTF